MVKKRKVGRPKKTVKDLLPNWKELIINKMSQGASKEELILELGISWDLFWRLRDEEKEFSVTIKKGEELCKAWWMKKARENLSDKNFSAVLWYMNMKNRFGWKDKSETDFTSGGKKIVGFFYNTPDAKNNTNNKTRA